MHYGNTTFIDHNQFNEYMKAEGAKSEDVFDYLFDVGVGKFLLEKGKKYFHKLFEKWDPQHLHVDEDFDEYMDNDGLKNIIGNEGMQNLNMNDYSCQAIKALKSCLTNYCPILSSIQSEK